MKARNRQLGIGNRAAARSLPPYSLFPITYSLLPERSDV
ncbi:MAG: hypothetical protein RL514_3397 [Verrucomicrobiota bacterium]|jgi:hypothetical protein